MKADQDKWRDYFKRLRKRSRPSLVTEEANCWYMIRKMGRANYEPYHRIAKAVLDNFEFITRYKERP